MSRRPPRGFKSWHGYNAYRVRHGVERGLTPSQARGHPRPGERPASQVERQVVVIGPNGAQVATVIGVHELSRAGSYDQDVRQLLAGRLPAASFNRRWSGRTIGGVTVPNAGRVQALGRGGLAGISDFYPAGPGGGR